MEQGKAGEQHPRRPGTVAQLIRDGTQTMPFSIVLSSAAEEQKKKNGSDMTCSDGAQEHLCTFNSFISATPLGGGSCVRAHGVSVQFFFFE